MYITLHKCAPVCIEQSAGGWQRSLLRQPRSQYQRLVSLTTADLLNLSLTYDIIACTVLVLPNRQHSQTTACALLFVVTF